MILPDVVSGQEPLSTRRKSRIISTDLVVGGGQSALEQPSEKERQSSLGPGQEQRTEPIVNHDSEQQLLNGEPASNHGDIIENAVEDGVIVLKPTLDQWKDFPFLLDFVKRLGVENIGICKVYVPQEDGYDVISANVNLEGQKVNRLSMIC